MGKVPKRGSRGKLVANRNSPNNLGHLQQIAADLVQSGLAPNTRKSYSLALQKLSDFRSKYDLQQTWPIPLNDILNFIAYLVTENISTSTVTAYLSGISYYHKLSGYNDTTKHFIVGKALEGCKRKKGHQKDPRSPITIPILTDLVKNSHNFCSSVFEATMFSAAFTLAFFAMLRVSEFTKNGADTSYPQKQVQFKHVRIHKSSIKLTIVQSKTQQRGQTSTIVIHANGKDVFPVANLAKYLHMRPKCANNDLFIHFDHSSLTTYQFNNVLKKAIEFLDITHCHIRSHSFRIGGATYLANKGVNEQQIMSLGRWKSHAF